MQQRNQSDLWFGKITKRARPQLRLFCFAYAGGGASVYRGWAESLPNNVELWPVQLPGRESRIREKPYVRMNALIPDLKEAILPHLQGNFCFYGHSLGALVAFELTHYLRENGLQGPVQLFASGRSAPHLPNVEEELHHLEHDEFIAGLRRLDGTPESILQNAELMELLLPILRADFEVFETYEYRERGPLEIPITAYGGLGDRRVSDERLDSWRQHTDKTFTKRFFPGGHFFINTDQKMVLPTLATDLTRLMVNLG